MNKNNFRRGISLLMVLGLLGQSQISLGMKTYIEQIDEEVSKDTQNLDKYEENTEKASTYETNKNAVHTEDIFGTKDEKKQEETKEEENKVKMDSMGNIIVNKRGYPLKYEKDALKKNVATGCDFSFDHRKGMKIFIDKDGNKNVRIEKMDKSSWGAEKANYRKNRQTSTGANVRENKNNIATSLKEEVIKKQKISDFLNNQ